MERKAQYLYNQRHIDESAATRENRIVCAYAFAVAEQNADSGIIVTAPTCGACGVVPAALKYMLAPITSLAVVLDQIAKKNGEAVPAEAPAAE